MTNIKELIIKKRDRGQYTRDEIDQLVELICDPAIPDYQISALLMAIYLQGMNNSEITFLTNAMANSGDRLDFSSSSGVILDKHSTGGVGDKTSLILVPILNELGLRIAKLSGRGLGHTGGTLDKLSVFDGFRMDLNSEEIYRQVDKIGMVITGQTESLVPADKRMYTLRDLTGTIESLPLIVSSIMSKKIASGARYILLDVKVGNGAMFEDLQEARTLAEKMVAIGHCLGVPTKAILTDMQIPLGKYIGNSLEIKEAIDILRGEGDKRLRSLCIHLTKKALELCGLDKEIQDIDNHIIACINSGRALSKLKMLIEAQGGNSTYVDHPEALPVAKVKWVVRAKEEGYIAAIHARKIGLASMFSGAGRIRKEDRIDLTAGVEIKVDYGQWVNVDDPLAVIYTSGDQRLPKVQELVDSAFKIEALKPEPLPLILGEY